MRHLQVSYRSRTILLIAITVLVKLFLGSMVELDNDEAYYWTYARHLQWNYFDHPPMVGLCIRVFTANLLLHHEFFMRLPAVLSSAGCAWIVFKTGAHLKDDMTGWIAACLYTASFYASVVAGLLILPDAPQLFFWLLSVYLLLMILDGYRNQQDVNRLFLFAGITIGLCILSKVHGVFIWVGFGGFLLVKKHPLLKNKYLYISLLITMVMTLPALFWSIQNHFSTYQYHSSRIHFMHFQPGNFITEVAGEIAYSNPINFFILACALLFFKKKRSAYQLLKWLGFPLIITVQFFSLFNSTLPHWNGPAYVTLIPWMAVYIRDRFSKKNTVHFLYPAVGILLISLCGFIFLIDSWPNTLGSKSHDHYGEGDVTLDMSGFRALGDSIKNRSASASPSCIITDYWFPGGALDFYVGFPLKIPVKVIGPLNAIHHFAWQNLRSPPIQRGTEVWYITMSNFYSPPSTELMNCFREVSLPLSIPQYRHGKMVRFFYLVKMKDYQGGIPDNGVMQ